MADTAALQLSTTSPRFFLASFPTSPDSPRRDQLLWHDSASSGSAQRGTFQDRGALSAPDSLTGAIDDCHGAELSSGRSYQRCRGVFSRLVSLVSKEAP